MDLIIPTLNYLCSPWPLFLIALGTLSGILVGAIPGLTGGMLIALSLPLTFSMQGTDALVLMVSMYVGSISGGLVTATLLKMPGTPSSIITTLDGYPMAQAGKPARALGLGICASFVGGIISWIFLATLAAPLAAVAHTLGPFDYFSLTLTALAIIALVEKSVLTGIASGVLGILASMPGTSPVTGDVRFTFGYSQLDDGFKLLPTLIGLYALSEVFILISKKNATPQATHTGRHGMLMSLRDYKNQAVNLIRSSVIGTWIGVLPGIGASIGSVTAYTAAKKFSKSPEEFGNGSEDGIVASESANNATVAGALIPLLSLGIPASVVDAILIGAMIIHGLQPGPLLMNSDPLAVSSIIGACLVANVFMFVFMLIISPSLTRLASIPRYLLTSGIMVFCIIGSYSLANRMFDVFVMLAFGILGLGMRKLGLGLAPFVIGFVLGPIAEENLGAGLMATNGSWAPLITRPVSLVLILLAISLVVWPSLKKRQPPKL
ncbi:tripartite tricarboxylate transporter permease [Pelagicoccus mobilis]|uniref:Tripartite tricarboxylate transporter permease n=1 Tax=Pelagicoccus mobilis TaxID=415221 RepID=A0A934S323_9BACT|nr:tripartite tricarboxylate transporter permease [Pelagicoccus mobilis]MBK1879751.1 tripartite tricarboxylate transporter permease [Pelagicoccus mobilis]